MSFEAFAVVNANVIPMDEERVLGDQTVIVQNGRIQKIGDASSTEIPTGAKRINAPGQYMIPSLTSSRRRSLR